MVTPSPAPEPALAGGHAPRHRKHVAKMNLHLNTDHAWELEGNHVPADLLRALRLICAPGDRLVFGCYDISEAAESALLAMGAREPDPPQEVGLDTGCYFWNRKEWPKARAFEVIYDDATVLRLVAISKLKGAGKGNLRDSFYDDVAVYRAAPETLGLVNFNHASNGQVCYLSGRITREVATAFSKEAGMTCQQVAYPPRQP